MNAVRYYSRGGNTKILAEAIAEELQVEALGIDAKIEEEVETLFLGGALYAYGIDKKLKAYIEQLDKTKIKKVVVFSTSWLSKHAIALIKKGLKEKEIPYVDEFIYARGKPNNKEIANAKEIAKKYK
ncbi:MAG: hypothetical protein K6E20_01275 [Acholeplasmatales bacterium]|nr:hypothetical protein [Acholeplasmatales bacterium]